MRIDVKQTQRGLYDARFCFIDASGKADEAVLKGKLGSMEASISGAFRGTHFEMKYGRNRKLQQAKAVFRPYLLWLNGAESGTVYQTKQGGFLNYFEFHQMVQNGQIYNLFPIGFGKEGSKCPIYAGDVQIALVEKDCVICDGLHEYHIFSEDATTGLISVLFCMYMYVNSHYKPGVKPSHSKETIVSVTTNKELKEKYDPDFKKQVGEVD